MTGAYRELARSDAAFAFERGIGPERLGIFLNLTDSPASLPLPAGYAGATPLIATTGQPATIAGGAILLPPDGAVILRPQG